MTILGKGIIFSIFVIFLSLYPLVINATEESVILKNEVINPGSFYYPFKRLWEKGIEKLQFSKESRINFHQSQLKIRLSELNYVVENNLLGEVQQSSERFAYSAGILTDQLVEQNKSGEKEKVILAFEADGKFLEKLRDVYPANTSFWMLIQHDINTLKILSERLK